MEPQLILPSEIPWSAIKGSDLEELLYWLFYSMGAKDMEWRIGGKGSGTADQGRDLELSFFSPSPDGTLTKQIWWVEAKGRTNTIEPREVHEAVLNAAGNVHIEVLVVATNTNFSNPTRDWVKKWQCDHRRPIVKLWERTELENLCSKNPLAVIRLHAKALSPQGKAEVASSKLWDYASFSDEPTLRRIWEKRDDIAINERTLIALVASEFANGDISVRSWALSVTDDILISSISNGLVNIIYLVSRANEKGVRQEPLIRTMSYLILVAIARINYETVASFIENVWNDVDDRIYPDKVKDFILEPIIRNLQTELRDVCTTDCRRIMTEREILKENEIANYWDRLRPSDSIANVEKENKSILIIEAHKEPCKIGFSVNENVGCPLYSVIKPHSSIKEFLRILDKIVRLRRNEKSGE